MPKRKIMNNLIDNDDWLSDALSDEPLQDNNFSASVTQKIASHKRFNKVLMMSFIGVIAFFLWSLFSAFSAQITNADLIVLTTSEILGLTASFTLLLLVGFCEHLDN